jgi:hypothetical protein
MHRFLTIGAVLLALVSSMPAQRGGFDDARAFVGRVQRDLQRAGEMTQNGKERERISNAQRHLSAYDKGLSQNKFDKGALDDSIRDVENVVQHNTLQPQDRDNLQADVNDLRVMREKHGSL